MKTKPFSQLEQPITGHLRDEHNHYSERKKSAKSEQRPKRFVSSQAGNQGDQIGRIFAYWAIF
jgi:hypothetical protein